MKNLLTTLLFISAYSFLLLPVTTQAIESQGLGGYPANPNPNIPATEDWFIYTIIPGDSINDALMVANNTDETKTLELYPADQTSSSGGGLALKQQVEEMNEVGAWIDLEQSEVTLNPGQSQEISFTVTAPSDLSPGEYIGGIIIQEKKPPLINQGLALHTRMGVRMYLTVPGEIIEDIELLPINYIRGRNFPSLNFEEIWQVRDTAQIQVQNNGNLHHDVNTVIQMRDFWGNLIYENHDISFQVLKNSTYEWNSVIDRPVWGGIYSVSAKTEIKMRDGNEIQVTKPLRLWLWPVWWINSILVVISMVILALVFRKFFRKKND